MDCGFTERGIAAGCSWATTLVHIYSLDPLKVWQAHNPRVELGVFIDDLLGSATAAEEHAVVGRLAAGAAALRLAIEGDLDGKVAETKSAIIAGSDSLLSKLRVAFGRFGGQATKSASNLGVVFSQAEGAPEGPVRRH